MSSVTGKLLYHLYHVPAGRVRDLVRGGPPWQRRRTEAGRRAMIEAAGTLPPIAHPGASLPLHLLTGNRFWYQTAFCLWTFAQQSRRSVAPVIYDDGTLQPEQRDALSRLFPTTKFVPQPAIVERLDAWLPADRFPTLRERWRNYPNIRKLTDPHVGASGWKLVIDSDLLFFHRPALLVDWLTAPDRPLHAVDCETSYGYAPALMAELAGAPIAERLNVGLCGLNGAEIDWEQLEYWSATLIARDHASYYLEQALVAMLLASRPCAIAPADAYVTRPDRAEANAARAIMHHYVADSKRWYFQQNWRRAVTTAMSPGGGAR